MEAKEKLGFDKLWKDVAERHKEHPLHLMVGGGDQLYCDEVRCMRGVGRGVGHGGQWEEGGWGWLRWILWHIHGVDGGMQEGGQQVGRRMALEPGRGGCC